MEKQDLISRINESAVEFDKHSQNYLFYSGYINLEDGRLITDPNPKNINMRDAVQAVFKAYPYAVEIISLVELYLDSYHDIDECKNEVLEERLSIAKKIKKEAEKLINYAISKLPNQFTNPIL